MEVVVSGNLVARSFAALLTTLLLAGSSLPARANGNFSHVWVAADAVDHLDDGDLKDLLSRPGLLNIIRNGGMFPDGGYAVSDGYGEISHWEPFQLTYLEWIGTNFEPPWSDEAAEHIAFLMGMAAHGLTDQIYDGMYLQRHAYYDEHGSEATLIGVDGATDACFAVTQGVMELPEQWVPAEVLAPLYADVAGHNVEAKTLELGHSIVVVAIMAANDAVTNPKALDEYMTFYPWACSHQDDVTVPGSPPVTGRAVAKYWQALWARLHGESVADKPLAATYFSGGTPFDQPTDSSTPESWVSFVMPFGLAPGTVNGETVAVTDGDGQTYQTNLHVYYGSNSHVVNIKPQEDWPLDTEFTVTVSPPIASWDGHELEQIHTFTFATLPEPAVVVEEPAVVVEEYGGGEIREEDLVTLDLEADLKAGVVEEVPKSGGSGCAVGGQSGGAWQLLALLLLIALIGRRRFSGTT
jgi:hypothetical protein